MWSIIRPMPYRRLRPDEISRMVVWHHQNPDKWTYRKLADYFKCSVETAHRHIARAEIRRAEPERLEPQASRSRFTEGSGALVPPRLLAELHKEDRAALDDFRAWRYRFLERDAPAFQLEMIGAITGGED